MALNLPFASRNELVSTQTALAETQTILQATQKQLADWQNNFEVLQEGITELERNLSEPGWNRIFAESERELSRDGLTTLTKISRILFLKNPIIRRAVTVQALYVWGQGATIKADSSNVDYALRMFMNDKKNKAAFSSLLAQMGLEMELQIAGNLFFVFFVHEETGRVIVRTVPFDEIATIISDPEDKDSPWFYLRRYTVTTINPESGYPQTESREEYYPDWNHHPEDQPAQFGNIPVRWDFPVFHVAVNKQPNTMFGVSELYSTQSWSIAYKQFLENWAAIVAAYSKFAFNVTTKGGIPGVSKIKGKVAEMGAGTDSGVGSGNLWIASEGAEIKPIKTTGATTTAEDARYLRLMVASGTGVMDHYLSCDPQQGALATAKSLERPMELQFNARREIWKDIYSQILNFVIDQQVRAKNGLLYGEIEIDEYGEEVVVLSSTQPALKHGEEDRTKVEGKDTPTSRAFQLTFPELLEHDRQNLVNSIVTAATMGNRPFAGTLEPRLVSELLLHALGIQDAEVYLSRMYPDPEDGTGPQERITIQKNTSTNGWNPGEEDTPPYIGGHEEDKDAALPDPKKGVVPEDPSLKKEAMIAGYEQILADTIRELRLIAKE